MCGRKYDSETAEYERAFQPPGGNLEGANRRRGRKRSDPDQQTLDLPPPNFNIKPTHPHVVYVANEKGEIDQEVMTWGFKPEWSNMTLFNSRDDKLEGRVWGKAFRERRVVVPVAGFYEWSGPKNNRQPHAIHHADGSLMFMAGLWVTHEDERCYSIITSAASPWMQQLHDRQPVILKPQWVEEYLLGKEEPWDMIESTEQGELASFPCNPLDGEKQPSRLVAVAEPEPVKTKAEKKTKPKGKELF
jgi:putative SOS response-associated peptidase YedK